LVVVPEVFQNMLERRLRDAGDMDQIRPVSSRTTTMIRRTPTMPMLPCP
jgi:hypothetical protein